MPRHVITMTIVVGAFFGLLWFGVVILGESGGKVMLASIATLFLIGLGITLTTSSVRNRESDGEQ